MLFCSRRGFYRIYPARSKRINNEDDSKIVFTIVSTIGRTEAGDKICISVKSKTAYKQNIFSGSESENSDVDKEEEEEEEEQEEEEQEDNLLQNGDGKNERKRKWRERFRERANVKLPRYLL